MMKRGDKVFTNHRITDYAGWAAGQRAVFLEYSQGDRDWCVIQFERCEYPDTVPSNTIDPPTILDKLAEI